LSRACETSGRATDPGDGERHDPRDGETADSEDDTGVHEAAVSTPVPRNVAIFSSAGAILDAMRDEIDSPERTA
jgi:hypothetical protein